MQKPPYFWRALYNAFVLLPLLFQVLTIPVAIVAQVAIDRPLGQLIVGIPFAGFFLLYCLHSGRRDIRAAAARSTLASAPETSPAPALGEPRFAIRYLPVLVAAAYTLLISLISLLLPVPTEGALFGQFAATFTITHIPACFLLSFIYLFGVPSPWLYLLPSLAIYAAYGGGLALGFRELKSPRTLPAGRLGASVALLVVSVAIGWRIESLTAGFVSGGGRQEWLTESKFNQHHRPFDPANTLVKISAPTLVIEQNHPRLDGATALFPVYAAAVQGLYKNMDASGSGDLVRCSTTPHAYRRLIAGEVDLAFVAQPSPEQRAAAETVGHPLQLTAIAKEAFVFFVHADNPVDGLTAEQIRAIYTKRIVNWKEVGGLDEKILPFQRPPGSGSQTALELKVMRGEKLPAPLREEFARGMGGVIQQVAAYKNSREALGYSFRVYATAMNPDHALKLLKVDGIAPTREAIRSGAYPYTVDVYAATAGTDNPHVPALLAWFLGPQGQDLIEETGYVSLPPP